MAAIRPRRQLALDTNVVLDLAGRTDFAHDFKETFQAKGYILRLPPTAALELHELYQDGETEEKRELARIALLSVRRWNVQPLDLAEIE